MVELDISEVSERFPDYSVALVVAGGLEIVAERSPALEAAVAEVEQSTLARLGEIAPAEIPAIRRWREAYKAFGVKKTSYRSSIERLVKAVQQGRGLPRVNSLVDAYNAVSLAHLMPVGADDLDRLEGHLAFRYAREGDHFVALGDAEARADPPKPGEVVYADGPQVLCRRWNWYQDARSAIGLETRRAVLTVQSLDPETRPEAASSDLARWLSEHCGASVDWAIADRMQPKAQAG